MNSCAQPLNLIAAAVLLSGLGLTQAAAAPAPTERGRVVLNCQLAADRKVSDCKVTRETPLDIGLGELAAGWAAGQTMPGQATTAATRVDLPLCFNISRTPQIEVSLDSRPACDALSSKRATYAASDVITQPEGFRILGPVGEPVTVVRQMNGGSMLGGAPLGNVISPNDVVDLQCLVLTDGSLNCAVAAADRRRTVAINALKAAEAIRMRVRQEDGSPLPGRFNFTMRVVRP